MGLRNRTEDIIKVVLKAITNKTKVICGSVIERHRTEDIIKVVLKAITNKSKVICGSVIERHSCHTEDKNKIEVTRNI
jgi:uncharacterized protein YfkK (UPF0435 family)